MHFTTLTIKSLKGYTGSLELSPVTILCGPNESGKTGVMEAFRLAVTGKADIGGTIKKQSEIVSGTTAMASAVAGREVCSWTCKLGSKMSSKHSSEWDGQGGLPITVDEFWGLTAEQRFSLIAGDELAEAIKEIEGIKQAIKMAKEVANTPPPTPDPYDGPPIEEIEKQLGDLSVQLSKSREATAGAASRKAAIERDTAKVDNLTKHIEERKAFIASQTKELEEWQAKVEILKPLVDAFNEAKAKEHRALSDARIRGLTGRELLTEAIDSIMDVVTSLANLRKGKVAKDYEQVAETLRSLTVDDDDKLSPMRFKGKAKLEALTGDVDPAAALASHTNEVERIRKAITGTQEHIRSQETEISRLNHAIQLTQAMHGTPLSDEVVMELTVQHEALQEQSRKARAWRDFDKLAGEIAVKRSKAAMQLAELEEELDKATALRNAITAKSLGAIEKAANFSLEEAAAPPLKLEITTTAKTAQLSVRTHSGVAIEAMAKSKRLLYGLALLHAIHMINPASCPVLVAECAEMDNTTFQQALAAVANRTKGNVLLEHWAVPATTDPDVTVIAMDELKGVAA